MLNQADCAASFALSCMQAADTYPHDLNFVPSNLPVTVTRHLVRKEARTLRFFHCSGKESDVLLLVLIIVLLLFVGGGAIRS